eukprot:scaffold20711_cov124-Skeletonema_marinoi.AAC.1
MRTTLLSSSLAGRVVYQLILSTGYTTTTIWRMVAKKTADGLNFSSFPAEGVICEDTRGLPLQKEVGCTYRGIARTIPPKLAYTPHRNLSLAEILIPPSSRYYGRTRCQLRLIPP